MLAAIVAAGQLLDRPTADESPDDATPTLAAPVDSASIGSASVAVMPVPALPRPADTAVASTLPAPVRVAPPATHHELPRPFAAYRHFESPLITPRLHLPRVLTPKLAELSALLSHARPGQPVAVTLSAYCLDGHTRRGNPTRTGIIAADPRMFPLARHVELFSGGRFLGRFLVDDTGGQVRGARIDIWTPDCDDARRFGSRPGVATLLASETR